MVATQDQTRQAPVCPLLAAAANCSGSFGRAAKSALSCQESHSAGIAAWAPCTPGFLVSAFSSRVSPDPIGQVSARDTRFLEASLLPAVDAALCSPRQLGLLRREKSPRVLTLPPSIAPPATLLIDRCTYFSATAARAGERDGSQARFRFGRFQSTGRWNAGDRLPSRLECHARPATTVTTRGRDGFLLPSEPLAEAVCTARVQQKHPLCERSCHQPTAGSIVQAIGRGPDVAAR